jgi:hypothetical protein
MGCRRKNEVIRDKKEKGDGGKGEEVTEGNAGGIAASSSLSS